MAIEPGSHRHGTSIMPEVAANIVQKVIERDCDRFKIEANKLNARRARGEAIYYLSRHFRVSLHDFHENGSDQTLESRDLGLKPGDSVIVLRHL